MAKKTNLENWLSDPKTKRFKEYNDFKKRDQTFQNHADDMNTSSIGGQDLAPKVGGKSFDVGGLSLTPDFMSRETRQKLGDIVGFSAAAYRQQTPEYKEQHGGRLGYLDNPAPDLSLLGIELGKDATIRDVQSKLYDAFIPDIIKRSYTAKSTRDDSADTFQDLTVKFFEGMQGSGIPGKNENGYNPTVAKKGGVNDYISTLFTNTEGEKQRESRQGAREVSNDMFGELVDSQSDEDTATSVPSALTMDPSNPTPVSDLIAKNPVFRFASLGGKTPTELSHIEIKGAASNLVFERLVSQRKIDPQTAARWVTDPVMLDRSLYLLDDGRKKGSDMFSFDEINAEDVSAINNSDTINLDAQFQENVKAELMKRGMPEDRATDFALRATYDTWSDETLTQTQRSKELGILPAKLTNQKPIPEGTVQMIVDRYGSYEDKQGYGDVRQEAIGYDVISYPRKVYSSSKFNTDPDDTRVWKNFPNLVEQRLASSKDPSFKDPILGDMTVEEARRVSRMLDSGQGWNEAMGDFSSEKDFSVFPGDTPKEQEARYKMLLGDVKGMIEKLTLGSGDLGEERIEDENQNPLLDANQDLVATVEAERERGLVERKYAEIIPENKFYPVALEKHTSLVPESMLGIDEDDKKLRMPQELSSFQQRNDRKPGITAGENIVAVKREDGGTIGLKTQKKFSESWKEVAPSEDVPQKSIASTWHSSERATWDEQPKSKFRKGSSIQRALLDSDEEVRDKAWRGKQHEPISKDKLIEEGAALRNSDAGNRKPGKSKSLKRALSEGVNRHAAVKTRVTDFTSRKSTANKSTYASGKSVDQDAYGREEMGDTFVYGDYAKGSFSHVNPSNTDQIAYAENERVDPHEQYMNGTYPQEPIPLDDNERALQDVVRRHERANLGEGLGYNEHAAAESSVKAEATPEVTFSDGMMLKKEVTSVIARGNPEQSDEQKQATAANIRKFDAVNPEFSRKQNSPDNPSVDLGAYVDTSRSDKDVEDQFGGEWDTNIPDPFDEPARPTGEQFSSATSARNYDTPERFGWNAPIPEGWKVVQSNRSRLGKDNTPMHAWTSEKEKTIFYNPAGVREAFTNGSMFGEKRPGVKGIPKGSAKTPEEAARVVGLHEGKHAARLSDKLFEWANRVKEENIANVFALGHMNDKVAPDLREKQIASGQLQIIPDTSDDPNKVVYEGAATVSNIGFGADAEEPLSDDEWADLLHAKYGNDPKSDDTILPSGNSGVGNPPANEPARTAGTVGVGIPNRPTGNGGNGGNGGDDGSGGGNSIPEEKDNKPDPMKFARRAGLKEPASNGAASAATQRLAKNKGYMKEFAGPWQGSTKQWLKFYKDAGPEFRRDWNAMMSNHFDIKNKSLSSSGTSYSENIVKGNDDAQQKRRDKAGPDYEARMEEKYGDRYQRAMKSQGGPKGRPRTETWGHNTSHWSEQAPGNPQNIIQTSSGPIDTSTGKFVGPRPKANRPVGPQPGLSDDEMSAAQEELSGLQSQYADIAAGGEGDETDVLRRMISVQQRINGSPAVSIRGGGTNPDTNPNSPLNRQTLASENYARRGDDRSNYEDYLSLSDPQNREYYSWSASNRISDVNLKHSGDLGDPVRVIRTLANKGKETATIEYKRDGNTTLSAEHTGQAISVARAAASAAVGGDYSGLTGTEQAATLNTRINKYIDDYVNKNFVATGGDEQAKAQVEKIRVGVREIARDAARPFLTQSGRDLGADPDWMDLSANAITPRTKKALQAHMAQSPELTEKIAQMGGIDEVWSGQQKVITDGTASYRVGQGGAGKNSFNTDDFSRSIYQTPIGKFQMASFMAKMFWQSTGGVVLDEAKGYATLSERTAGMSSYGGGELSSAELSSGKMAVASARSGETAYKQFGFASELPYTFGGGTTGTIANRVANDAGVAMGIGGMAGIGTYAVGALAASAGLGTTAGLVAASGWVGLGVAGVAAGVMLGGEAYNYFSHKDEDSGLSYKNFMRQGAVYQSVNNLLDKHQTDTSSSYYRIARGNSMSYEGSDQEKALSLVGINGIKAEAEAFNANKTWFGMGDQTMGEAYGSGYGLNLAYNAERANYTELASKIGIDSGASVEAVLAQLPSIQSMSGMTAEDLKTPEGQKLAVDLITAGKNRGIATDELERQGDSYAKSKGFYPGTEEYTREVSYVGNIRGPEARAALTAPSQMQAQLASQFVMQTGGDEIKAMQLVDKLEINTQTKAGINMSLISSLQRGGTSFSYGTPSEQAARTETALKPFQGGSELQGQAYATGMSVLTGAGVSSPDATRITTALASSGISETAQSELYQGNKTTWSNVARAYGQTYDTRGLEMVDEFGTPSGTRNGSAVVLAGMKRDNISWDQRGIADQQKYMVGKGISAGFAADFIKGGFDLTQDTHDAQMYGFQMASIGLQFQGIQAREQLNWGSGTYDNPAAGSMWNIEDRQRSLQLRSEAAGFASSRLQMDTRNQFAIENETAQRKSTQESRSYRTESVGFDKQTDLIQRANTRQGWQYQSQVNELNFSWSMEDSEENIRRSSGRERSLLIRQRDRQTVSQNLEVGETDRQRKSQEDLWKREDDRFKKQEEYIKSTQKLEDEAFKRGQSQREIMYKLDSDDLNRRMKEAKESAALQLEAQTLQRKFQADEIERSKQALGIQAAQAAAQYQYGEDMKKIQRINRDNVSIFEQMFASADGIKLMADSLMKLSGLRWKMEKNSKGEYELSTYTVSVAPRGSTLQRKMGGEIP